MRGPLSPGAIRSSSQERMMAVSTLAQTFAARARLLAGGSPPGR
jgi:hypothetical protein